MQTGYGRAAVRAAILTGVALALSGCADGIEFNGKLFDAMGVSSIGSKRAEPALPVRGGLVMPPSTAALPAPGTEAQAAAAPQQWPNDPNEQIAQAEAAEQAKNGQKCPDGKVYSTANSDAEHAKGDKLANCGTVWSLIFNGTKPPSSAATSDITPAALPPPDEQPAKTQASQ